MDEWSRNCVDCSIRIYIIICSSELTKKWAPICLLRQGNILRPSLQDAACVVTNTGGLPSLLKHRTRLWNHETWIYKANNTFTHNHTYTNDIWFISSMFTIFGIQWSPRIRRYPSDNSVPDGMARRTQRKTKSVDGSWSNVQWFGRLFHVNPHIDTFDHTPMTHLDQETRLLTNSDYDSWTANLQPAYKHLQYAPSPLSKTPANSRSANTFLWQFSSF